MVTNSNKNVTALLFDQDKIGQTLISTDLFSETDVNSLFFYYLVLSFVAKKIAREGLFIVNFFQKLLNESQFSEFSSSTKKH